MKKLLLEVVDIGFFPFNLKVSFSANLKVDF